MKINEILSLPRRETYPRYADADHHGIYVSPGCLALDRKNRGQDYDYERAAKDLDELVSRGEMKWTKYGCTPTDPMHITKMQHINKKSPVFKTRETGPKKLSKKNVKRRVTPKSAPAETSKSQPKPEADIWEDL